nr:MAG TPA: hypothetical protein [Caudoviricetes sp.]
MDVNRALLVVQNECIINHTAFNQPSIDSWRIIMDFVICQFDRRHARYRVSNNECGIFRQPRCGSRNNRNPIYHAKLTTEKHILGNVRSLNKRGILLDVFVESTGHISNTPPKRSQLVSELFHPIQESAVCIGLCDSRGRSVLCTCCNDAQAINIDFRDDYFIKLALQGRPGVLNHHLFEIVTTVDGEGESAILTQGHFLDGILQICRSAIARSPSAGIVIHVCRRNRINFDGFHTHEVIVVVNCRGRDRPLFEAFINLCAVLFCIVKSHFVFSF